MRARLTLILCGLAACANFGKDPGPAPTARRAAEAPQAAVPATTPGPSVAELAATLGALPAAAPEDEAIVELGRRLFFEPRLSGDASMTCATCHDPELGFTDGLPLSEGYPGSRYFRRTRGLLNTGAKRSLYWDGRMSAADLPTLIRDHIAEAHFFQADGRLVLERLRQVPYYEETFRAAMGGEPSYGRTLNALAAFVRSLRSTDVPFDRVAEGDEEAISAEARAGLRLFTGKAGCAACHTGPMLTDGGFHALGVPENPEVFQDPLRHITFRRFFKTLGVSEFHRLDHDPGRQAVTKDESDRGRFKTPTLREVAGNAAFMHNGAFTSLEEVVDFYDRGGGTSPNKDPRLRPLGLTQAEKAALVAFLHTLSGAPVTVDVPEPLEYGTRDLGAN